MITHFIKKNIFLKNILIVLSGTLLMQIILFLSSPILTRLIEPKAFGTYGIYISIISILSVVISGRYELAIMIPKENKTANFIIILSLLISILLSCILLVIFLFLKPLAFNKLTSLNLHNIFFILPIHILIQKCNIIFNYSLNRSQQFKIISKNKILKGSTITLATICLALTELNHISLILGILIGDFTALLFLSYHQKHLLNKFYYQNPKKLFYCLKRFKKFPLYLTPGSILNTLASTSPVFIITKFYGLESAGFFSFANRIISSPLSLIAKSTADVFRQSAATEYLKKENCRALFLKTCWHLFIIFFIPTIILLLLAPSIFTLIFGTEWSTSGKIVQIMSLMMLFQYSLSPLSSIVIQISERLDIDIIWQTMLFIGIISSLMLGYIIFKSLFYSIGLYSIWYSIMYIASFLIAFILSKRKQT